MLAKISEFLYFDFSDSGNIGNVSGNIGNIGNIGTVSGKIGKIEDTKIVENSGIWIFRLLASQLLGYLASRLIKILSFHIY